nr:MAG TPA: hypothetical protein [Caudoviricetes sp.]DAU89169.1 MAG TPA: hypothetical protein [Caudoviricetes sp.]
MIVRNVIACPVLCIKLQSRVHELANVGQSNTAGYSL